MKFDKLALLGLGALAVLGLSKAKGQSGNAATPTTPASMNVNPTTAIEPTINKASDSGFSINVGAREKTAYELQLERFINERQSFAARRGLTINTNMQNGTITAYRADGTVYGVYTMPQKTFKDQDEEDLKTIAASGGAPIVKKVNVSYSGGSTTSTTLITTRDTKTGQLKTLTEGSYQRLKRQGKVE